jgi:hypothetical protein
MVDLDQPADRSFPAPPRRAPTADPTGGFARSYLYLRGAIGLIGLLLPITVWLVAVPLSGPGLVGSISGYYHTGARDVLVGALCAIGVFLVAYRFNSDRAPHRARRDRLSDNLLTNLAGACAIGVALFPTNAAGDERTWVAVVHFACAIGLFAVLAFLSYYRFTRCDPGTEYDDAKRRRNRVYRTCGVVIAAALLVAVLDIWLGAAITFPPGRLYWEETVMVLAFAISWIVKGRELWPWRPGAPSPRGS